MWLCSWNGWAVTFRSWSYVWCLNCLSPQAPWRLALPTWWFVFAGPVELLRDVADHVDDHGCRHVLLPLLPGAQLVLQDTRRARWVPQLPGCSYVGWGSLLVCVRLSVSLFCYQARSLSSKINDMPDEFHNFQVAAMWDDVACWCVCVSVPKLECLVGLCRALLTHSLVLNQLGEDMDMSAIYLLLAGWKENLGQKGVLKIV